MSGYILSEPAVQDLEQIDEYVGAETPAAAGRLLEMFRATFELLATMPGVGRRREELGPRIRGIPVGSYVVFYRITEDTVEILRVLHGRRDLDRAFEE